MAESLTMSEENDEVLRSLFVEAMRFLEDPPDGQLDRFTAVDALKAIKLKQRVIQVNN